MRANWHTSSAVESATRTNGPGKSSDRSGDWLRQARWDMELARIAAREGHFEWAAFAALQAAEKACKSVHTFRRGAVWSHDLPLLLESLPGDLAAPTELIARGNDLLRHYLHARYPTMFAAGTPHENYSRREADQAIADAEAVMEFCEGCLR